MFIIILEIMAFIETIEYVQATGRLKEIYDALISKRGKLAEVHTIQSLNPETIVLHMDLYLKLMFGDSPLKRYQREMIAVIVSKNNKCDYCLEHHSIALNHFWKNKEQISNLVNDINTNFLSDIDKTLCEFAKIQTLEPQKNEALINKLRNYGFTDRAILDTTLIVAYFNFVNRLVLSLGIELDVKEAEGYNYD